MYKYVKHYFIINDYIINIIILICYTLYILFLSKKININELMYTYLDIFFIP